jgi:outer membrane protein assembly factor BamB
MPNAWVFQRVFRPELEWTGFLRMLAVGCILAIPWGSSWAGSLPRPDRQWLVRLQQVRQQIAEGRVAEAAPVLEQILTSGRWGYVPMEEGLHLPLEQAASLLIESLPPEALATWEAWCAGKAARQLVEVLVQRDAEALRRVVREYPGTRFAAEAALTLAADAFDRRQWQEAIQWAERVVSMAAASTAIKQQALLLAGSAHLRRGQEAQARQCFGRLLALGPAGGLRIGGQPVPAAGGPAETTVDRLVELLRPLPEQQPPPAPNQPLLPSVPNQPLPPDLDRPQTAAQEPSGGVPTGWPMFRGDACRNASADWTGSIGQRRWRLDMEGVEEFSGTAFQGVRGPRFFLPGQLPASQPILVDHLALVRLPTRLVAVDVWTGRQRWEYPPGGDPAVQQIQGQRIMPGGVVLRTQSPQAQLSRQRIFEDAPYGQVVVHASRLFLLDDLGLPAFTLPVLPVAVAPGAARPSSPPQQNRLIALDLRKEGKILWSVGGTSGEDEPALAGAFFLGPPLPVEGRLYVLLEQAGVIRLVALDENTGQLVWSLPIAAPERPIGEDSLRRLAGAMPSYADGVLVCPTSAGAVVAVDPWTRSVLWAYEIPLAESYLGNRRIQLLRALGAIQSPQQDQEHFSMDSTATLADGYVLVAPVESDHLFCMELQTGRLCWQRKLEDFRFVAAVAEEVVLAVGSQCLSGWRLHTGKPAWEEWSVPLPEGFATAGRGFRQGRRYWLPIVKGEESAILIVDIPTGRLEERLTLPTKTRIGNLAVAGQTLLFVSSEGVEAFGPAKP